MYQIESFAKKNIPKSFSQSFALQPKLKIGQPGDKYEREADSVADSVMAMNQKDTMQMHPIQEEQSLQPKFLMNPQNAGKNNIQMKCAKCEDKEKIQAKSHSGEISVSPFISQQIQMSKGNGKTMSTAANQFMSNAFGNDFSGVQLHTDWEAVKMNRQLGARAFTYGNDIFFNEGEYNPESEKGRHLLAHELTHTLQQGYSIGKQVQKYSHEDCDENSDLKPHIWPADHMAKTMVNNGIAALTASPVTAATNSVLDKHFNSHSSSTVSSVLAVLRSIKAAFDSDDYTYECEDDCDDANAYVYGVWSDIHLCMNRLRGRDNKGIAAIIVHESSHYYGGTDDNVYYFSFGAGTAPASLSASDAVENADSYEGFAYDI